MSTLDSAIAFAAQAHADHRRKYTNDPYIVHPLEVMSLVRTVPWHTEEMAIAAVLHDVVEDTLVGPLPIKRRYGDVVHDLVMELTERKVEGNRAIRKAAEAERLAQCSREAQTIKVADLISNTSTIVEYDLGFAKIYLKEKQHLLSVLAKADPELKKRAYSTLNIGLSRL